MTRRFDRDGNIKHHTQTLCAMAHLDYRQKATHDYSQLFLTIEQLGLDYAAKEEAFCRMVFNVMAANCDDHTKNTSFILREGSAWEFAPAYDVTHAYNPKGEWTNQHLTGVNGKFAGITRDDLLAVAERFGIGTAPRVMMQRQRCDRWLETIRRTGGTEFKRSRENPPGSSFRVVAHERGFRFAPNARRNQWRERNAIGCRNATVYSAKGTTDRLPDGNSSTGKLAPYSSVQPPPSSAGVFFMRCRALCRARPLAP